MANELEMSCSLCSTRPDKVLQEHLHYEELHVQIRFGQSATSTSYIRSLTFDNANEAYRCCATPVAGHTEAQHVAAGKIAKLPVCRTWSTEKPI